MIITGRHLMAIPLLIVLAAGSGCKKGFANLPARLHGKISYNNAPLPGYFRIRHGGVLYKVCKNIQRLWDFGSSHRRVKMSIVGARRRIECAAEIFDVDIGLSERAQQSSFEKYVFQKVRASKFRCFLFSGSGLNPEINSH